MSQELQFNQDMANTICERIMEGRSLRDVCRDEDTPAGSTVHKWLNRVPEFAEQYARATSVRADVIFDEMFDIADTPKIGERVKIDKEGNEERQIADMIEHRRLQVDTRKWSLARMSPRKYGDKLDLNHGGGLSVTIGKHAVDL